MHVLIDCCLYRGSLCNYDGTVAPGPSSELHELRGTVTTSLPTTYATTVDDAVKERDENNSGQISIDDDFDDIDIQP